MFYLKLEDDAGTSIIESRTSVVSLRLIFENKLSCSVYNNTALSYGMYGHSKRRRIITSGQVLLTFFKAIV